MNVQFRGCSIRLIGGFVSISRLRYHVWRPPLQYAIDKLSSTTFPLLFMLSGLVVAALILKAIVFGCLHVASICSLVFFFLHFLCLAYLFPVAVDQWSISKFSVSAAVVQWAGGWLGFFWFGRFVFIWVYLIWFFLWLDLCWFDFMCP